MKYQKNNLTHNRYGFVVGKTVDKRATQRNRSKRLFRAQAQQVPGSGFDVLFIVKPLIQKEKQEDIASRIQKSLEKVA